MSDQSAVKTKNIGSGTTVGPYCVIAEGVVIGKNVIIHPHVVIGSGTVIEDNVEIFPGAYLGKEPKGAGALARQPVFERGIQIGQGTSIGPHAIIYYDVTVGEHTLIGDGASIREQCRIGSRTVIGRYVTVNYNTVIGNRSKVMDHAWLAGNMTVGNDVFISGGVMTTNDNAMGRASFDEAGIKGPTIEDGAAVGANATLLPDIVVGQRAVIGSGSVVTKNVLQGTLVVGSPARLIRVLEQPVEERAL